MHNEYASAVPTLPLLADGTTGLPDVPSVETKAFASIEVAPVEHLNTIKPPASVSDSLVTVTVP